MVVFSRVSASVGAVILRKGEVWAADDPFVRQHRDLFTDEPPRVRRTVAPVEQATAEPGERRRRG